MTAKHAALFAPADLFPITYRRGRTAHLDVGGARGAAIRRALQDQLGMTATDVRPVGLRVWTVSDIAPATDVFQMLEGGWSGPTIPL